MSLAPYRQVLAQPGVRALLLLGLIARIPMTAVGITFTLHTVNSLHRSYAEAGLVTTVYTVAAAVSSPLLGRAFDRGGVRPVLAVTGLAQIVVWTIAPSVSYVGLLVVAVFSGLFAIPIFGLVRQAVTAMVPEDQRRPAFALDSMGTELSFMVGPAVAVAMATSISSSLAMRLLGGAIVLSAIGTYILNPPLRADHEEGGQAPPRRTWLRGPVLAIMVTAVAMTFILSGTDMAIVSTLREAGAMKWTGLVIAIWCVYSLIGGLIYGAFHKHVSSLLIVAAMGILTVPVGLAPNWLLLLLFVIPSGMLCAPGITSGNETLARHVPAAARGEAMGLLGSAMTVGVSLGAPVAGFVVDVAGPDWAFAAAGGLGALAVLLALPAYRGSSSHGYAEAGSREPELVTP
jgi:MFS family permease